MQRYRVNYGLLVGLAVGVAVIGGGIFGLYVVQKNRNAVTLLNQAEEAEQEGDIRKAMGYLFQYTRLREDDVAAAERFATLAADVAELPDAEPSEVRQVPSILESFLLTQPSNTKLRRRLTDLLMSYRRTKDALVHITYLLNEDPKNEELQEMKLRAMLGGPQNDKAMKFGFELIGYDQTKGEFDAETASTPSVHLRMAYAVRNDQGNPELADQILDHLIAVNPESSDAYLSRGQFLVGTDRSDEALEDLERALELDSENVDALMARARHIISSAAEEDEEQQEAAFESAYQLLDKATKLASSDLRVYDLLSRLERQRGDREAALAHLDAGIEAVQAESEQAALMLRFAKTRTLLDFGEVEASKKAIEQLAEQKLNQAFIDYLSARLDFLQDKWLQASREFLRLRPVLSNQLDIGTELNLFLGMSYERLEKYELALEAYEFVRVASPSNRLALGGIERMKERLGREGEVSERSVLNEMIAEEFKKPEAEQNWAPIFAAVDEFGNQPGLPPGSVALVKAEIFIRRGMYLEARKAIREAVIENPDDIRVWRAATRVIANDPDRGPAESLEKLESLVQKFGDLPMLRLDKADFLIAQGDEGLKDKLLALGEGIGEWTTRQQTQLWKGLAERFERMRDSESRRLCLQKVASLSPDELPTLLSLFHAAIESNSTGEVDQAQQSILNLVGSKDDATYLYTEAQRLLWEVGRGTDRSELDRVDKLIERALVKRPEWHELFLLQVKLALARGDRSGALAALDQAAAKGRPNGQAILLHVALLMQNQRYGDAKRVIDRLPESARLRLLGRSYAEIQLNTGDTVGAADSADEFMKTVGENAAAHLWYGKFLSRLSIDRGVPEDQRGKLREKAGVAIAKAVELGPQVGDAWETQIKYYVDLRDRDKAEQALRQAQLALTEDQLPLLLARGYAWLGRWFDAETAYVRLHELYPDNLQITRELATFYIGPRYPRPDKTAKLPPLLNEILSSQEASLDAEPNESVFWARRLSAELLSRVGGYQNLLRAQKLLASNVVDGQLGEEDKLQMARILAGRPEPASRELGLRLLQDVQRNRVLEVQDDVRLGTLYYLTGRWDECRQQMIETISRNPQLAAVRESYIRMLLKRGGRSEIDEASRQVGRLQAIAPQSPSTLQLFVQVAIKMGRQAEARAGLVKLLPRNIESADPNSLLALANLLKELGDLQAAEKLFRAAAAKKPAAVLLLADFIGANGDMGDCFKILDDSIEQFGFTPVLTTALAVLTARRNDVGDAYDEQVQAWFDQALREDPELVAHRMQLAAFRDLQRRSDEAADLYRALLEDPAVTGTSRAIVLNNLSYLLAISADSASVAQEAKKYVDEAVVILGPQADILDTRAVVLTAMKRYDDATADLELSLTDNPTASKYFHKARAHMLAGQRNEAEQSWVKAVELGLTRESVAISEQEQYDELQQQLAGVTQAAS